MSEKMASPALHVCRTCMLNKPSSVNLFEFINDSRYLSPITFADILKICTPVQAVQDDGLPQTICECCSKILSDTYAFRNQCEKNDEILRNSYIKSSADTTKSMSDATLPVSNIDDIAVKIEHSDCEATVPLDESKSKPYIYKCNDCTKEFIDVKKIEKHVKIHFKNRNYSCGLCKKRFFTVAMLTKHSVEHSDIQCEHCWKKFPTKYHLTKHLSTHLSLKCLICEKFFSSNKELSDHIVIHRQNSPLDNTSNDSSGQCTNSILHNKQDEMYYCVRCKRYFKHLHSLNIHVEIHKKELPFLCYTCGRCFAADSDLKRHMVRHIGEKSLVCHICSKRFKNRGTMKAHVKTHFHDSEYVCEICNRSYTNQDKLNEHKSTHIADHPWECHHCNKRFTLKAHLKRHLSGHLKKKLPKCEHCD